MCSHRNANAFSRLLCINSPARFAAAPRRDALGGELQDGRRDNRNAEIAGWLLGRGAFRDPGRTVPLNAGIQVATLLDIIARSDSAQPRPTVDDETLRRAILGGGALAVADGTRL